MRKKRLLSKKILHILAVAALSVSLLGGQMQAVLAENPDNLVNTVKIEESRLIFDELYVKSGVSLAEVALPEFEEGTLKWEDESYIPEESVVECTVIFQPKEDQDLSKYKYLDGWDSEKKIVKTKITVIVEEFDDAGIDTSEEVVVEEEIPEISVEEEPVSEEVQETPEKTWEEVITEKTPEDGASEVEPPESSDTEEEIASPEGEVPEMPGEFQEEVIAGDEISEEETLEEELPESSNAGDEMSSSEGEIPEVSETPEEAGEETIIEDKTPEDETIENETSEGEIPEGEASGDESQDDSNVGEDAQAPEGETPGDNAETGNADDSEQETEADSGNAGEAEVPDATVPDTSTDIFNRDLVQAENDHRLVTIDENISEEEKQRIAEENHCSNGITVTGNNLPWYVQFRAYEMEEPQFSINADTNVFRGFEFELWDLRTNTEYEIPEGEYVSVIVPVLEGYTYTVEHILDSGAVETIIPTVNGSTLIFSTHSFSPFGIAGSTTIVGGDIMDDGYQSPTATPTATPSPKPTVTTKPETTTKPAVTTKPATTPDTTKPAAPTAAAKPTVTAKPGSVGGQTVLVGNELNTSGTKNDSVDMSASNKPQQNGAVNSSQTKLPVQTGDTTMILPFVILVAAAFFAIICVVVLKKRKK